MRRILFSFFVAFMAFGFAAAPAHAGNYGHHHGHHSRGHGGGGNAVAWIAGIAVLGVAANAIANQDRAVVYEAVPERQCRSNFVGHTYDGRPVFQKICWDPYYGRWVPQ